MAPHTAGGAAGRRHPHLRPVVLPLVALALVVATMPAAAQPSLQVSARALTRDLVAHNEHYWLAAPAARAQRLGPLLNVAAARHRVLATLIEHDPGEVLRVAVPARVRASLPVPVHPFVEEEAAVEGVLEVLVEDRYDGHRYLYFLRAAAARFSLHFATHPPQLPTGTRIRARGIRVDHALALESGTTSVETLSSVQPNTFGAQSTIVILVNFGDNPVEPYPPAQAEEVVFGTTSDFYWENSYQQTWLIGAAYGWFTIPLASTVCDTSKIRTYAQEAAAAAGVDLSLYTRYVYAFPQNAACRWWGLGTVGGAPSHAWVNGNFTLHVVGHELGHNFGDYHSHSLSCDLSGCTASEYGDSWDIMGARVGHLNPFQKERLGWLDYGDSPPISEVQFDGTYSLDPYVPGGVNPKALKVLKATDPSTGQRTWYYLEYRLGLGFDSALPGGVLLRTGSESSGNSSYLWDTASSTSTFDAILEVGEAFDDPWAAVTITALSADSSGAAVHVTVGTPPCVRTGPTAMVSPSATPWVAPGTPVDYTVEVTNNDGESCEASVFALGATRPEAWTALFDPATLTLSPGASASSTLTLTSPVDAADGLYTVEVTATNSADPSFWGSAAATQMLVSSLDVAASTDQAAYTAKEWVNVAAVVSFAQTPVADARVTFTIEKPQPARSKVGRTVTTDANGVATFRFRVKPNDPAGQWRVGAVADFAGRTGQGSASFVVQ